MGEALVLDIFEFKSTTTWTKDTFALLSLHIFLKNAREERESWNIDHKSRIMNNDL